MQIRLCKMRKTSTVAAAHKFANSCKPVTKNNFQCIAFSSLHFFYEIDIRFVSSAIQRQRVSENEKELIKFSFIDFESALVTLFVQDKYFPSSNWMWKFVIFGYLHLLKIFSIFFPFVRFLSRLATQKMVNEPLAVNRFSMLYCL